VQGAIIGFFMPFVLLFVRVPLGFAMLLVGMAGFALQMGLGPALAMLSLQSFESGFPYMLSIIPLFILMGNLVTRAGISQELYDAAYTFVGYRRGGLAIATMPACGGFGAVCGSSLATAASSTASTRSFAGP
jgi:TRAP-type mannitol/chloroaromatic compound transport system permease large subunit